MPTSAQCQTHGWKVKKCHPSAACISCPTSDIWKAWMSQMTELFMLRWRFWGVGRLSVSEWLVSFMEKPTEVEMLWTAMPYWGKQWEGIDTVSRANRMKDDSLFSHLYLRSTGEWHLAGNRCWGLWGRSYLARPCDPLPLNTESFKDCFNPPEGNDTWVSIHHNAEQMQSPHRHAHCS